MCRMGLQSWRILAQEVAVAVDMGRFHLPRHLVQAQDYGRNIVEATPRMSIQPLVAKQGGDGIAVVTDTCQRTCCFCTDA